MLRRHEYGESDLIVALLTGDRGLQRGFARGGRKSVKRFGAALEPFSVIDIQWQPGRGELLTLLDAELRNPHQGLRLSLDRLALAGYAVEILEMLLHEGEPQPQLYSLLQGYLGSLSDGGEPRTARLLFELRLVQELGYIPHLLHCSECFARFDEGTVAFDPARGGSLCDRCGEGTALRVHLRTIGSLSRSLRSPIGQFADFRFGERTLKEGAQVLATVLQAVLPRTPKSLRFLSVSPASDEP